MQLICNTDEGDVKNGIDEWREREMHIITGIVHVVQVGKRKYNNLKKEMSDKNTVTLPTNITHIINTKTMKLHLKSCAHVGDKRNLLYAHITNPDTTGLIRCRHCMPCGKK